MAWAHGLPEGPGRQVTIWAAEHLRLFSNGLEGLVRQCKHNVRGHDMFLLGEARHRAVWYYFPVALSIKLGLPLLILPTALALLRPRALNNWACAAAATLLAFSLAYRVQIGIRLVLPMVALAVVGLAAAAVRTAKVRHSRARETERGASSVGQASRHVAAPTTDDPGTAGTAGGLRGLDRRFFGPHLAARPLFRERESGAARSTVISCSAIPTTTGGKA